MGAMEMQANQLPQPWTDHIPLTSHTPLNASQCWQEGYESELIQQQRYGSQVNSLLHSTNGSWRDIPCCVEDLANPRAASQLPLLAWTSQLEADSASVSYYMSRPHTECWSDTDLQLLTWYQ